MDRRLESIHDDLTPLAEKGKVKGFLSNVRDAKKLGGLLEDIRDAVLEYQVRTSLNYPALRCLMFGPDFIATRYLQQEL